MTREEIREGIDRVLYEAIGDDEGVITAEILGYLHSQGVVIKVDRETPGTIIAASKVVIDVIGEDFVGKRLTYDEYIEKSDAVWMNCQRQLEFAGYVAVESLIKEESND